MNRKNGFYRDKSLLRERWGLVLLLYDQQGRLVAKQGTRSSSLQTETIHLSSLSHGSYTLVAWQTTTTDVDPTWPLVDADQLASTYIVKEAYLATFTPTRSIGLYTTNVTVGSKTAAVQAEMEPMGSIVNLIVDGYTSESEYRMLSLRAHSQAYAVKGFYLDPSRTGEDRWVYDNIKKEEDDPISITIAVLPQPVVRNFTLCHGQNKVLGLYGTRKADKQLVLLSETTLTLEPGVNTTLRFDLNQAAWMSALRHP